MRALVQRVTAAKVTVGEELISSIGKGLCVLVGISRDDTPKDREYIARKLLNLRVFDDDNKERRWDKNIKEKQLELLCVSQFTLYTVLKGNKPDFHCAMAGDRSKQYYEEFLDILRQDYRPELIKDGKFGAYMQVHIQNDGPVTIGLESPCEASNLNPGLMATGTPEARTARQMTSGTPVAIVTGHQQDKVLEKACRYVSNLANEFPGQTRVHLEFKAILTKYRENLINITEMMVRVGTLFSGHTQLLCSFTGLLPTGHSLSIMNYDPNQVRVQLPGQRPMLLDEAKQRVEGLQGTSESGTPVADGGEVPVMERRTQILEEVLLQLERLTVS